MYVCMYVCMVYVFELSMVLCRIEWHVEAPARTLLMILPLNHLKFLWELVSLEQFQSIRWSTNNDYARWNMTQLFGLSFLTAFNHSIVHSAGVSNMTDTGGFSCFFVFFSTALSTINLIWSKKSNMSKKRLMMCVKRRHFKVKRFKQICKCFP